LCHVSTPANALPERTAACRWAAGRAVGNAEATPAATASAMKASAMRVKLRWYTVLAFVRVLGAAGSWRAWIIRRRFRHCRRSGVDDLLRLFCHLLGRGARLVDRLLQSV